MTEVSFYTGAADPLRTVVRLCAKALDAGKRLRIFTPDAAATQTLGRRLWCDDPMGFLPHCRLDDQNAARTPIWLDHAPEHFGQAEDAQLLINLAPEPAPFFARFERVLEVVGTAEAEVLSGRRRFRYYKERGYMIHHHDLSKPAS